MSNVVPFRKPPFAEAARRRPGRKGLKPVVGFNIYIDPVEDEVDRKVDRNVLHGILAAFGFHLTRGLFKRLFASGGVHRVRCREGVADTIRAAIERVLPDLTLKTVRRAA